MNCSSMFMKKEFQHRFWFQFCWKGRPEFDEGRLVEGVDHDGEYVRCTVDHDQLVDARLVLPTNHLCKSSSKCE